MDRKNSFLLIVLIACVPGALHALPPSLVLGAYGEGADSSLAPSLGVPYTDARLQGTFGWREALAPGSYLAVSSRASLAPYLTNVTGFVDTEFLSAELGLPLAAESLIFSAGTASSFVNQTGVGGYAQPAWSAEYRLSRDPAGLQPSLRYLGRYLYEQQGSDDHLSQSIEARIDRSTDVRLETWAAAQGGWDLWTKQQAYDSSGNVTGPYRQDWLGGLEAGARGFAGFSLDWSADVSGTVRLSDASTTSTGVSQLVLPGGSRLTGAARATASWTPSRFVSLSMSADVQDDWYFVRAGLNADGTFSSSNLNVLAITSGLRADWTADNVLYLVIQASLSRTLSNDVSVAEWGGTLSAGVEYSF